MTKRDKAIVPEKQWWNSGQFFLCFHFLKSAINCFCFRFQASKLSTKIWDLTLKRWCPRLDWIGVGLWTGLKDQLMLIKNLLCLGLLWKLDLKKMGSIKYLEAEAVWFNCFHFRFQPKRSRVSASTSASAVASLLCRVNAWILPCRYFLLTTIVG